MRPALRCLGLVLSLPAGAAAAQPAAVEMTVVFEGPAHAAVRTQIPPDHPFAGSEAFHVLAPSPETDWRRAPVRFARDPAGALLFRASARADEAGWVHVPVPLPDEAPEPGAEPAFAARITPPPGYRIADAFPALTADGEGVTLEAHLPAPPSLLRFRLVPEEGFAIGLATFVDGALALLLIGLGVFGARRLLAPSPPAGTSPP